MAHIKGLLKEEMPREKLQQKGPRALDEVELLAILLRVGTREKNVIELSREILSRFSLTQVSHKMFEELLQFKGVNAAKASQIVAAFEFARRLSVKENKNKIHFTSVKDIYNYVAAEMRHLPFEQVIVIYVDTKNALIKKELLHQGSINFSIIEPRKIIKKALDYHASGFFLIHNHPSGDSTPSKEDIQITQRVKQISQLLELRFLDHIIIGETYFSFHENKHL